MGRKTGVLALFDVDGTLTAPRKVLKLLRFEHLGGFQGISDCAFVKIGSSDDLAFSLFCNSALIVQCEWKIIEIPSHSSKDAFCGQISP